MVLLFTAGLFPEDERVHAHDTNILHWVSVFYTYMTVLSWKGWNQLSL